MNKQENEGLLAVIYDILKSLPHSHLTVARGLHRKHRRIIANQINGNSLIQLRITSVRGYRFGCFTRILWVKIENFLINTLFLKVDPRQDLRQLFCSQCIKYLQTVIFFKVF